MKHPRRGNNHVRANGKAVHVPDHAYTPSKQKSGQAVGQKKPDSSRLAEVLTERFTPTVEVTKRFQLGEPVETKPDWLDTEIGRVDFTEDLVVGFQSTPPPLTEKDAWAVVVDAADRYARLTAFIAAEQSLTCQELCELPSVWGQAEPRMSIHPRKVLGAIERRRVLDDEDLDNVAERIVYSLDGSLEEDKEILLGAARGYFMYIRHNSRYLTKNQNFNGEYTLESAMNIASHLDPTEGPASGHQMLSHDRRTLFVDGRTSPEVLLDHLSEDVLRLVEESTTRPEGVAFLEKHPAGLRFNTSHDQRVEIIVRETVNGGEKWTTGLIRRVVTENGRDHYVSSENLPTQITNGMLDDYLLNAVDFSARPAPKGWIEYHMIGFEKRNASRESMS